MRMMAVFKTQEDKLLYESRLPMSFKYEIESSEQMKDKIKVIYILTEHAPAGRKFKYNDDVAFQIAADRTSGMTFGELSKKYNCSISTIQNYIKKSKQLQQPEPTFELLDDYDDE